MNKIILTGNAVKDIDLRYNNAGTPIGNGTIAVRRNRKSQNGEYETDFINFVVIGKRSEVMAQYIKKGDKFGLSGSLQIRTWDKDNGERQYFTEVLVDDFDLPSNNRNNGNTGRNNQTGTNTQGNQQNNQNPSNFNDSDPFSNNGQPIDISDDMLPF